jgi:hypothetical protein
MSKAKKPEAVAAKRIEIAGAGEIRTDLNVTLGTADITQSVITGLEVRLRKQLEALAAERKSLESQKASILDEIKKHVEVVRAKYVPTPEASAVRQAIVAFMSEAKIKIVWDNKVVPAYREKREGASLDVTKQAIVGFELITDDDDRVIAHRPYSVPAATAMLDLCKEHDVVYDKIGEVNSQVTQVQKALQDLPFAERQARAAMTKALLTGSHNNDAGEMYKQITESIGACLPAAMRQLT